MVFVYIVVVDFWEGGAKHSKIVLLKRCGHPFLYWLENEEWSSHLYFNMIDYWNFVNQEGTAWLYPATWSAVLMKIAHTNVSLPSTVEGDRWFDFLSIHFPTVWKGDETSIYITREWNNGLDESLHWKQPCSLTLPHAKRRAWAIVALRGGEVGVLRIHPKQTSQCSFSPNQSREEDRLW